MHSHKYCFPSLVKRYAPCPQEWSCAHAKSYAAFSRQLSCLSVCQVSTSFAGASCLHSVIFWFFEGSASSRTFVLNRSPLPRHCNCRQPMGALTLIVGAVALVPATLAVVLRSRVPVALTGCLAHAAAVGFAVAACSSDSLSPYTTWLLQVSSSEGLCYDKVLLPSMICKVTVSHTSAAAASSSTAAAVVAFCGQSGYLRCKSWPLNLQPAAGIRAEALGWSYQPCV
jgi:hypothetical protein